MESFKEWLQSQGKTKATIRETVNYAKKYGTVLDTGQGQCLLTLSPRNKQHAMTALANLAKYQGRYDQFLQLRQRYNLKWSKGDSIQSFNRFFNPDLTLDVMLQRIRKMIEILPPFMGQIVRFACLIGLRPAEVVESVRLLNNNPPDYRSVGSSSYYNPERQALEHFRFPEIFLRQTKKAYISFVTSEIMDIVRDTEQPTTYNDIRLACWSAGIKCELRFCRKIFASWLHQCGIASEAIDFLQGRISTSVFSRHYLTPSDSLRTRVIAAVNSLKQEIERRE